MRLIFCTPFLFALTGCAAESLPVLPVKGWTKSGTNWMQANLEVRDANADGRIDYVRIQDPPGSFNHRMWIDTDYDGHFDEYRDNTGVKGIRVRVPKFEP